MFLKPDSLARATFLSRGLALALLLGLVSCGKEDDEALTVPLAATYDSLWANLFNGRCNTCHAPGKDSQTEGGPDMSTKDSFYEQLFNKKGSDYPNWESLSEKNRETCLSLSFIKPKDAANSLVVGVLDPDNAPCVVKSHLEIPQSVVMSPQVFTLLKEWINQGAAR